MAVLFVVPGCGGQPDIPDTWSEIPLAWVGLPRCAECHAKATEAWEGSHHDWAMRVADATTVVGDFSGVTFSHAGVTSTFFMRDGKYFVQTDGPDGELRDYAVAYTYGIEPLQQYLVEFPGGRLQALAVCWDSRPATQGGQLWFHLYPDEQIDHTDILHWTGRYGNWNSQCADCHSTGLKRNYDLASDTFQTEWFEINVSCEACHGPGSRHAAWADAPKAAAASDSTKGLAVVLKDQNTGEWHIDPATGIASRTKPRSSRAETQTCAPCHSRRRVVDNQYEYGRPLLDSHRVSRLESPLYFDDGQIRDEVYVYGSFIQSKMYHAGVACTDCHDAHTTKVLAADNSLCYRCHMPDRFDTRAHHFHELDSTGAQCVECHMPARNYMVVDPRRDHSMRVPRPDLSVELGIPNACNDCHIDRTAEWAADATAKWYASGRSQEPHFAQAMHAGRIGAPGAEARLIALLDDDEQPLLVRATAANQLERYPGPPTWEALERGLNDGNARIRLECVEALATASANVRWLLVAPLLQDPVPVVQAAAGNLLADVPRDSLRPDERVSLDLAIQRHIDVQMTNADRPESHLNIGVLYLRQGEIAAAEASYRTALRLEPKMAEIYVNLADLKRGQGDDESGERVLREGIEAAGSNADLHHALGLLLIRNQRREAALEELGLAAQMGVENPRYAYVYALALQSMDQRERARQVLRQARQLHPYDSELKQLQADFDRD